MPYTVQDIYNAAITLCDFYDENNSFSSSPILKAFKNKAPYLCDMGQRDLIYGMGLSKIESFPYKQDTVLSTTKDGYNIYNLPTDFMNIVKIIDESSDCKSPYIYLKYIFIDTNYTGDMHLMYKYFPRPLTTMSSTFSLDDNVVFATLPYYLATNFLIEENPTKSALYISLYEKAKQNCMMLDTANEIEQIINEI